MVAIYQNYQQQGTQTPWAEVINKCANTTHNTTTKKEARNGWRFCSGFQQGWFALDLESWQYQSLGDRAKNQIINIQNEPQYTNGSASGEEKEGRLSGDFSSIWKQKLTQI